MYRKVIYILIIGLMFNCLTGCKSINNKEKIKKQEIADSKNDKIITTAVLEPKTLNPILNNDPNINYLLQLVFEPLFTLDDNQKPIPNLVENYELAKEGHYIKIKLNKDLLWQDGKPITTNDIIFTISQLQKLETNAIYKKCVQNFARVTKINDLEMKIFFKQPSYLNLYELIFPIIPKHYYTDNMTLDSANNLKPLGNGKFQFSEYIQKQELKFINNTKYFKTKPKLKGINCIIVNDDNNSIELFKKDKLDIINSNKFDWNTYIKLDNAKVNEYTTYYYDFLGFNFKNTILTDKNVRKAIAFAINREELIKDVFLGHFTLSDSPIVPNHWLHKNTSTIYNYDINKAKNILSDAGWKYDASSENKILKKENKELNLTLLVNEEDEVKIKVGEYIREQLIKIGININIMSVDYANYKEKINNSNFDLLLDGWKLDKNPDLSFALHSKSIIPNGNNYFNYNDSKMDSLLLKAYTAINEKDAQQAYNEIMMYIQEQLPYYSFGFRNSAVVIDSKLNGELKPTTYDIYNNIESLY